MSGGLLQGAQVRALALKTTAAGTRHAADPAPAAALTHAVAGVFTAGLLVILTIPELPLRGRGPMQQAPETEAV